MGTKFNFCVAVIDSFCAGLMTKVRTLELVMTPAIRCMMRAQLHVDGNGDNRDIPPSEVDFPGTDVLMRVRMRVIICQKS